MTRPDWDDDRLAAAFRELVDRPTPSVMADAIHERIVGTQPHGGWRWRWSAPLTAGFVLVAVVVAGVLIGVGRLDVINPSPITGGSASRGASAPPDEPPTSVGGLQTITIREALAVRDAGVDDQELAVEGWFTPAPAIGCPAPNAWPTSPIQPWCPDTFVWLTEEPQSLFHATGDGMSAGPPLGPALNPDMDGLDRAWYPALPQVGQVADSLAEHVVVIGHFDDRRAALCPADAVDECRDRFVVDKVAWVDGPTQPQDEVDLLNGETAVSSIEQIRQIVADESPDGTILSITTVDGRTGLVEFEPTLDGDPRYVDAPIVWIVRVLETDRLATYLIVDGTDSIAEMNPRSRAIDVGGQPAPSASSDVVPPEGVVRVTLTSPVGSGRFPVTVTVIDLSGSLVRAFEKGTEHGPGADGFTSDPDSMEAFAEPGVVGGLHLVWVGSICDTEATVTVSATRDAINIDEGPRPPCDAMAINREIVLVFDRAIDVSGLTLTEGVPTDQSTR